MLCASLGVLKHMWASVKRRTRQEGLQREVGPGRKRDTVWRRKGQEARGKEGHYNSDVETEAEQHSVPGTEQAAGEGVELQRHSQGLRQASPPWLPSPGTMKKSLSLGLEDDCDGAGSTGIGRGL